MKKIVLKTELSKEECFQRLQKTVFTSKKIKVSLFGIPLNNSTKPYEGSIYQNSFEIYRNINYQNSALPIIQGIIKEKNKGSLIQLQFKMSYAVWIILVILSSLAPIISILIYFFSKIFSPEFNPQSLLPLLIIGILDLASFVAFNLECKRAKKDLLKVFEAEILNEI